MKLVTLYDNVSMKPQSLTEDWGFSLYIKMFCCHILFDTGANGNILLHNMQVLSVETPDRIFISHLHSDHTGGLNTVLRNKKNNTIVYYPYPYYKFKEEIGVTYRAIKDTTEIYPGIYSTGSLNFHSPINEQSLVLKEPYGLILIVGCSHPGIQNIIDFTTNKFGSDIFLLIGGFHLFASSRWSVEKIARILLRKVHYIAPSHCTGKQAKKIFKAIFKKRFIENGVGQEIEINNRKLVAKYR